MSKHNSKVLARLMAAAVMVSAGAVATAAPVTTTGNLTVGAELKSGCEVVAGAISFGEVVALNSTGDQLADSGTTFKVACSTGLSPLISAPATRKMMYSSNELPFNLSLSDAVNDDFPPTATPVALAITKDGTQQSVPVYAKILKENFRGLPAGIYSATMVVSVTY